MTYKQIGRLEVRPNTLRDQAAPNTFRRQAGPGTVGTQDLNSGGGKAVPRRPLAQPQLRLWVSLVVVLLAVLVTLYLLTGTP